MTSNTERTGLVTCTGCLSKLTCTGCSSKLTCCGWLVRGWRLCLVTARVDTGVKPLQPGPGTEAHTSQPAVRGGHCTVGIGTDTVDTPLHSGIYLIFEHAAQSNFFIISQAWFLRHDQLQKITIFGYVPTWQKKSWFYLWLFQLENVWNSFTIVERIWKRELPNARPNSRSAVAACDQAPARRAAPAPHHGARTTYRLACAGPDTEPTRALLAQIPPRGK